MAHVGLDVLPDPRLHAGSPREGVEDEQVRRRGHEGLVVVGQAVRAVAKRLHTPLALVGGGGEPADGLLDPGQDALVARPQVVLAEEHPLEGDRPVGEPLHLGRAGVQLITRSMERLTASMC